MINPFLNHQKLSDAQVGIKVQFASILLNQKKSKTQIRINILASILNPLVKAQIVNPFLNP
jgi:hypothetical protein